MGAIRVLRMGRRPKPKFKVVIGVDVSGSVSDEDIQNCLGELKWLFAQTECEVMYVTFDVGLTCEPKRLESVSDVEEITSVEGRGGTSFKALVEYAIEENAKEVICFTDGYGDWDDIPEPSKGMRWWWLTTDNEKAPWGNVLKIER